MLAFVRAFPGVHEREVERRLGMSSRLAAYHLHALAADGVLERVPEKGFARFFPRATRPRWSPADVALVCALRRTVAFRITLLLLAEGALPQRELARRLGLARPSTTYHLQLMVADGIVAVEARGRERWSSLRDPARVRGVLADFTPLPEDHDPFTQVWHDLVARDFAPSGAR